MLSLPQVLLHHCQVCLFVWLGEGGLVGLVFLFCFVWVFLLVSLFFKTGGRRKPVGKLLAKSHRSAPSSIWAQENTAAILLP